MANHTSTHILNFALKKVLGEGIEQKGSLVDDEKLRFDFSHGSEITCKELIEIEKIAQKMISQDMEVYKQSLPLSIAKSITGVRAVFGEKYPDPVTVVSIGVPVSDLVKDPSNPKWNEYAVEFCGGTHLNRSSEAETFCITQETGTGKGIRRIVAHTGTYAKKVIQKGEEMAVILDKAGGKSGAALDDDLVEISKWMTSLSYPLSRREEFEGKQTNLIKKLSKEKQDKEKEAVDLVKQLVEKAKASGNPLIVQEFNIGNDKKAISHVSQEIKDNLADHAVMILSKETNPNTKVTSLIFSSSVSASLSTKLNAGDWVKDTMALYGGKGGGSAKAAQATAEVKSEAVNLDEAVKHASSFAQSKLK